MPAIQLKEPKFFKRKGVVFHYDNIGLGISLTTLQNMEGLSWEYLKHPLYSSQINN